jgi:hypothetical protein
LMNTNTPNDEFSGVLYKNQRVFFPSDISLTFCLLHMFCG